MIGQTLKMPDQISPDNAVAFFGGLPRRVMRESSVRWLFENRNTGEITIVQRPNWMIIGWVSAVLVGWISSSSTVDQAAAGLGFVFAVIWAASELLAGVNPFRRILGATVLILQVASQL